jgi:hypothetical protein
VGQEKKDNWKDKWRRLTEVAKDVHGTPKTGEEKTNDPHPYGKRWHVRIVDVGNRSSDLWIWTIFLLKGIEIEFHLYG